MSGIKLYFMNAVKAYERREELLPLIPPCYREKSQEMKHPVKSGQELAAGYLMYKILRAGQDYVPALSAFGKPMPVGDMPCFNVSHSGDWAVLAVSDMPVGVDIEKVGRIHWAAARKILSPAHLAELENADEAIQPEIFAKYWTRLEAGLKLSGEGFSQGLKPEIEQNLGFCSTFRWHDYVVSFASEVYDTAVTEEVEI